MKIYVASSWRNAKQPSIVYMLQLDDHEVYDFRNPSPGNHGFHWSDIGCDWRQWTNDEFLQALTHKLAQTHYLMDFEMMNWADACVLVLPAGSSSHAEMGWFVGAGKPVYILLDKQESELMYLMAGIDNICTSAVELLAKLGRGRTNGEQQ